MGSAAVTLRVSGLRTTPGDTPEQEKDTMIQPIRIEYGQEREQFGDLYLPDGTGAHPVLVVIHGGRWQMSSSLRGIAAACASLAQGGLAVWNVEYRRLGIARGGWPGTWEDVASATDYLRELAPQYALDLNRVIALGHSAGGPLALWLAGRHRLPSSSPLYRADQVRLVGVVSSAGVNDLRAGYDRNMGDGVLNDLLGGGPDRFEDRYASVSPPDLLPYGVPQLLIHGTADRMVSISVSEDHLRVARESGDSAELVTIPGADHFQIRDPASPYWPPARDAILRFARETAAIRA
jgi:acetyl esterase/lipase